jgi:hypothetical protein
MFDKVLVKGLFNSNSRPDIEKHAWYFDVYNSVDVKNLFLLSSLTSKFIINNSD